MKKNYQNAKRLILLALSFMLLSYVHGQIVVTGTVMDGKFGGGLPGANVVVKGTQTGTQTDIDGKFTIKVPNGDAVLVISAIGYVTQNIKVGDKTVIDLTMKEDVKQIEEVVKVGYGVQKKTDVTGSVSQIGGDDIASRPVIGVDQAMAGKVAGVSVTSNSGSPGADAMVRIRGTGSVNNADPLYVVDGIPQGGIPNINPTEIKSISILKDASACAIYGSRAANGVVLISTKEGKMAKKSKSDCENTSTSEISFDGYYGVQTIAKMLDVLNASEYYQQFKNNKNPMPASIPSYIDTVGSGTDWQKQIYRAAPTRRYTIAYETGSENSSVRISGNIVKQDGIVKGSDYESMSIGGKGSHNLKKWLSVQETWGFSNAKKHLIPEGAGIYSDNPVLLALVMDPTVPVQSALALDSYKGLSTTWCNPVFNQVKNPSRVLDLTDQKNNNNGFSGSFGADIKPHKNLVLRSQIGINGYYNTYTNYNRRFYQSAPLSFYLYDYPKYTVSEDDGWGYTWTNTATWSKDFMSRIDSNTVAHSLSVLVGNEVYYSSANGYEVIGYKMKEALSDEYPHISSSDSLTVNHNKSASELSMTSLLGRVNYAYKGKLLLTSNVRFDWSSRFVKGNRLGVFPSFSAGYKISDEDFFKNNENLRKINECKLRLSWGEIGNQYILGDERYPFASRMRSDYRYYSFNGVKVPGTTIDNTPNANLIWETTEMINGGIDFAFLQNKLTFALDIFSKKTRGMIVNLTLPYIAGAERGYLSEADPSVPVNAGSILNTGFETSVSYKGDFTVKYKVNYEIGGNIAYVKNKVKKLGDKDFISSTFIDGDALPYPMNSQRPCRTAVDYGISDFYGLKVEGVYQNWEEINKGPSLSYDVKPGDFKYKDVNGDGYINDKDYVHLGSPLPKLTYGFYLSGDIGIVDYNFSFQGTYGNKIYNAVKYYTSANTGYNNTTDRLDAWTEENGSSESRLGYDSKNYDMQSSAYIESGSYLRLKDVVIGVTLPEKLAKKFKVNKLRVYGQIQNAFTITKYSGYDPEVGQISGSSTKNNTLLGVDLGTYPRAKTFLGGINFSF